MGLVSVKQSLIFLETFPRCCVDEVSGSFCIWRSRILICRLFFLGLQTTCLLRREWFFPLLHWRWKQKSSRRRPCLSYIVPTSWIISNCRMRWERKSDDEWLYESTFVSYFVIALIDVQWSLRDYVCTASQTQPSVISTISMQYLIGRIFYLFHSCVFKGKI